MTVSVDGRRSVKPGPANATSRPAPVLGPPNGTGGPDPADPEASAQALLDALVEGVHEIVRRSVRPPTRVALSFGGASVEADWSAPAGGPPAAVAHPVPVEAAAVPVVDEHRLAITAPTVGTFYRSPEPGARPFIEVGDVIEVGQQVAIIEAMKLMNPIEADCAGRVVAIPIADGTPVEYGEELVVLEPVEEE